MSKNDSYTENLMVNCVDNAVLSVRTGKTASNFKHALNYLSDAFRFASFNKDRVSQSQIARMRNWVRADLAKITASRAV